MTSTSTSLNSLRWNAPVAGISGGYTGDSEALRVVIVFLTGLAMYNACELTVAIFLTFNRYSGVYFWSLLISCLGTIPYALGFLLKYMILTTGKWRWFAVALNTAGWYAMITGQSLVLWSRLHLILYGERKETIIKYTKWMIITDAVILHIPTTVLSFGSNGHTNRAIFVHGYIIMEKIQMAGFFCQEVILSSVYIIETRKILYSSLRPGTRITMRQLVIINFLIIILDLGLLGLEAASLYILETLVKGVVYSIKLKLEFAILGKLVNFVRSNEPPGFVQPLPPASRNNQELDTKTMLSVSNNIDHANAWPLSNLVPAHGKDLQTNTHGGSENDGRRAECIEDITMVPAETLTPTHEGSDIGM